MRLYFYIRTSSNLFCVCVCVCVCVLVRGCMWQHWVLLIGQSCRRPSPWVTAPPGTMSVSITAEDAATRPATPSARACHRVWWTDSQQTHTLLDTRTVAQFLSLCSRPCLFLSLSHMHTHTHTHPGANSLWAECLLCERYWTSAQSFREGEGVLYCLRGGKISCWFIPNPISSQ